MLWIIINENAKIRPSTTIVSLPWSTHQFNGQPSTRGRHPCAVPGGSRLFRRSRGAVAHSGVNSWPDAEARDPAATDAFQY